ncbi:PREDICTED: uncharacterized protein LOC104729033 [Camelina sativa]|uniref:Uncharacterized protein LOC104729033 n=1 Tax=Camelina sativa TaxID=90675 RepID=A0ABM0UTS4_CAMSA|nr:PREDICTED: uncharacterized protein LOC104729033 [Camelina sativa]
MTPRKKLSTRRPKRKKPEQAEVSAAPNLTAHDSTAPDATALDAPEVGVGSGFAIIPYIGYAAPLEERDSCPFEELGVVSGDDCEVVGDEDCDDVGYEAAGEEDGNQDNINQVFEKEDQNRLGVEEQFYEDFEAEFGEGAREDEDETDNDSGDDIFDDEKIPDPLSESEEEDNGQGDDNEDHVEEEDPEVQLELG